MVLGKLGPEQFFAANWAPYCGTALGTTGPVETKLGSMGEVKGVVVGAFGEGSEDLHSLIHHLAISRVRVA